MKLFNKYVLISDKQLVKQQRDAEKFGKEAGTKESKKRIEDLERFLEKKDKALATAERKLETAEETIEVMEEERDTARDVVKQQIQNEDFAAVIAARKAGLDKKEASLRELESQIDEQNDRKYKNGYADGAADMSRKISDITQQDRDNAMKIAMVAAASHTPVANMKEINNELRLTEGTENSEV